jgi:hypothetical protein
VIFLISSVTTVILPNAALCRYFLLQVLEIADL